MRGTSYRTIVNRYWRMIGWNRSMYVRSDMRRRVWWRRGMKIRKWIIDVPYLQSDWHPVHWADPWLNSTDRTDSGD